MAKNTTLTKSIYDKHLEVHYDCKTINTRSGPVEIKLQGKIFCPVLNQKITPIVCSKIMDYDGWPRSIDPNVCTKQASCYICKSISKNMSKKSKKKGRHI